MQNRRELVCLFAVVLSVTFAQIYDNLETNSETAEVPSTNSEVTVNTLTPENNLLEDMRFITTYNLKDQVSSLNITCSCNCNSNETLSENTLSENSVEASSQPESIVNVDYQQYVYEICSEYENVSPELILAIIETESGGNCNAVSASGHNKGLMQIDPRWQNARMLKFNVTDIFDPKGNIQVGAAYMSDLISNNNGNIAIALMQYNGDSNATTPGYISSYASHIIERAEELSSTSEN